MKTDTKEAYINTKLRELITRTFLQKLLSVL